MRRGHLVLTALLLIAPTSALVAQESNRLQALVEAAEAGDADAQFNLGTRHAQGQGVATSDTLAVQWLRRAADQGHTRARLNLGMMYLRGRGVAEDPEAATDWFRLAAADGYPDAMHNLGAAYANGTGVMRDAARAYMWLWLATGEDDRPSPTTSEVMRDAVARRLTPEQRAEAEQAATTCRDSRFSACGE